MSWDQYDAKSLRTQIRKRLPLVAALAIIVSIFAGFFAIVAQNTGSKVVNGADTISGITNGAQAPATPTTTALPKADAKPEDHLDSESAEPDQLAAIDGATKFVKAWARPNLPQDQWLAGIKPFTSPDTFANFTSVEPRNVPSSVVTGTAKLEASSALSASVLVPTDGGEMRVVLDSEWKANYIEPTQQPGSVKQTK